jgi:hypothetical protein
MAIQAELQVDWAGEQLVNDSTDCCSVCASPLLNLRGDLFGAGRPSVYCSNACKMKAYRKRQKPLLNARYSKQAKPLLPASIEKPLLSLVPVHPLQNLAPFLDPDKTYRLFKIPSAVWDLSDEQVIALGYFIGVDGQIHQHPVNIEFKQPDKSLHIKNFDDLKSFLSFGHDR